MPPLWQGPPDFLRYVLCLLTINTRLRDSDTTIRYEEGGKYQSLSPETRASSTQLVMVNASSLLYFYLHVSTKLRYEMFVTHTNSLPSYRKKTPAKNQSL